MSNKSSISQAKGLPPTAGWAACMRAFRSWLELERGLSMNSVEAYLRDVQRLAFFAQNLADPKFEPGGFETTHIDAFVAQLYDEGLSRNSQSRILSGVRNFCKFLLLEGILESDPLELLDSPRPERKLPDVLSVDEIQRIIEAIDLSRKEGIRNRAILETMYSCGLRVSEVVGLRLSCIDEVEGFVKVIGKGNKERLIPIGELALETIARYIDEYRRFADVILVSSASGLRWHPRTLHRLRQRCAAIVIRRNQGYDFGSWRAALNLHRQDIDQAAFLVLTNDSFWGPIIPLDDLFQRLDASSADVIGLTDNQMYEPHLSSAFTAYKSKALQCPAFDHFWGSLQIWPRKRDLVKQCEVGLPVQLRGAGLKLESLYTHNSNGNVLHYDWKPLIEHRGFPFLKVSLLRDNPTKQPVDSWPEVIGQRNPQLAASIERQLRPKPGLKRLLEQLRR